MKQRLIEILKRYWKELIYIVVVIIYLCKLNILNHRLLEENFSSYFALLMYENNIAVYYFAVAMFLFILGGDLGYRRIKKILDDLDDGEDILISILFTICILVLLVLIICFINNPILKAIMGAGLLIFLVISAK